MARNIISYIIFETRYQKINLNISPLLMNPFPYWHYMIPDISNLILLQVQKTENIYEKCIIANEIINTIWKASLHIYTDGSVDTKINVAACSIFIPQLK